LIAGESEITRAAVAKMRAEHAPAANRARPKRCTAALLTQANNTCALLEQTLTRIKQVEQELVDAGLAALRQRVANLDELVDALDVKVGQSGPA
jgi:hypothetical protein